MVMEIQKQKVNVETLDIEEVEKQKPQVSKVGKTVQDVLGFLLKYNPIDPVNDLVRGVLSKFDLEGKYEGLNYWGWAYPLIRYFCRVVWNQRISGEMFPEYGGAIFCSNHVSHIDPFLTASSIQRRVHWMSKEENFETPIVRTLFRNLGAFPVKRGTKDEWAYKKACKELEKGHVVGIFPEGTRSVDGTIGEDFKTGCIRLAIANQVPIVPGCVVGSKNALPKGKLVMKPTNIKVRIGKAIYYDEFYGKDLAYPQLKKLADELREKIVELWEIETYGEDGFDSELSIGAPGDAMKSEMGFNIKNYLKPKKIFGDILTLIDDVWYGLLKNLEVIDVRSHFQEAIQNLSGNLVDAFSKAMMPYKMIDFDKFVPEEGGIVVAPNHASEWDVAILGTAMQQNKRMMWQMAKQTLFDPIKVPIVNAWVRTHHSFPLKRGMNDAGCFNYGKELCEKGEMVCVYPEGTTSAGGGEILPFHTGAVRMAIEAKVPILPVGITGTEKIYPKHAKMLNFGKGCVLKAGEPFTEHAKYFDQEMPDYEVLKELSSNLRERVKDLLMYNFPEY